MARELGALTVGVVTQPFAFEGKRGAPGRAGHRGRCAASPTRSSSSPTTGCCSVVDRNTTMVDAFRVADDVLRQGVQGICDLITVPGLINLDFADVRTIMRDAGTALWASASAKGETRAADAARAAISLAAARDVDRRRRGHPAQHHRRQRPLAVRSQRGRRGDHRGGRRDANIIFGAVIDEKLEGQMVVTVIATGFSGVARRAFRARTAPVARPCREWRVVRHPVRVAAGIRRRRSRHPPVHPRVRRPVIAGQPTNGRSTA